MVRFSVLTCLQFAFVVGWLIIRGLRSGWLEKPYAF
ncbi:MAG: hypothetical protein JWR83_1222 [Aeromicrobium sp.]|nr:hypothetical protein [Aeromicrobium sp.]